MALSNSRDDAAAEGRKLFHWNSKTLEKIPYLRFIAVGQLLGSTFNRRTRIVHSPEDLLHLHGGYFLPERGKQSHANQQPDSTEITDASFLRHPAQRLE